MPDEPAEVHLGQYLAGTLWFYWVGLRPARRRAGTGWTRSARGRVARAIESRLKALWVLGYVAVAPGRRGAGAVAALQECREEARALAGTPTAVAYAVHRTGCLALVTDDMTRAEELLRAALERYREIGELNSNVLMAPGRAGDGAWPSRAICRARCSCARRSAEICEDHGERWALAYALYVLALRGAGPGATRPGARGCSTECAGHRRTPSTICSGSVLAVELLALVTVAEGDPAEAAVLQGAAARMWPSVGLPLFGSAYYNAPHALCEAAGAASSWATQRYDGAARGRAGGWAWTPRCRGPWRGPVRLRPRSLPGAAPRRTAGGGRGRCRKPAASPPEGRRRRADRAGEATAGWISGRSTRRRAARRRSPGSPCGSARGPGGRPGPCRFTCR